MDERQYRNVLLPNGDVTLCSKDFERRHVLGNLLRDEYEDLLRLHLFRVKPGRWALASLVKRPASPPRRGNP
ncbi:SPASM domain-containing protein [Mesorhizobium sp. M0778]|uniref:SPASM domain-containing protein n=1 Tax=Mesorhizobium sp. M0778 TaxID=2956999 RepID=UPI00333608A0